MSTRGLTSSVQRGTGRQGASRESWRRRKQTNDAVAGLDNAEQSQFRRAPGKHMPQKRPTHFLSLPLGGHTALQSRVQGFTDALLASNPPIVGIDKSILMQPARLHITLGVMSLVEEANSTNKKPQQVAGTSSQDGPGLEEESPPKTVSDALALLHSLKGSIIEVMGVGMGALAIPLNTMGVLKTEKNQMAHVLWVGPKVSSETTTLDRISRLVNKAFRDSGFITETRPLKLHCTVLNTKYRRGGGKGRPIPFSAGEIFSSGAYRNLLPSSSANADPSTYTSPENGNVDFGSWIVDEIQLCAMGGRDPTTGGYLSVGSLKLL